MERSHAFLSPRRIHAFKTCGRGRDFSSGECLHSRQVLGHLGRWARHGRLGAKRSSASIFGRPARGPPGFLETRGLIWSRQSRNGLVIEAPRQRGWRADASCSHFRWPHNGPLRKDALVHMAMIFTALAESAPADVLPSHSASGWTRSGRARLPSDKARDGSPQRRKSHIKVMARGLTTEWEPTRPHRHVRSCHRGARLIRKRYPEIHPVNKFNS